MIVGKSKARFIKSGKFDGLLRKSGNAKKAVFRELQKAVNLEKYKNSKTAKIGEIRLFFIEKVACDPKNIVHDRAVFVLIQKLR